MRSCKQLLYFYRMFGQEVLVDWSSPTPNQVNESCGKVCSGCIAWSVRNGACKNVICRQPGPEVIHEQSQLLGPVSLTSLWVNTITIHPGRLTWNLQITHLERKMIFQTSVIMFHVNLHGCRGEVVDTLRVRPCHWWCLGSWLGWTWWSGAMCCHGEGQALR